jgi:quercetin dioxygenase-like cupin family protein
VGQYGPMELSLEHPSPSLTKKSGGQYLNFLNQLASVRTEAGDRRALSVVEFVSPQGFGPPLHNHLFEDELFIVTAGELSLRLGDDEFSAGAGSVSYLPFGIPHTFMVVSDEATYINVSAVNSGPAPRFDKMVTELGEPIGHPSELVERDVDPGRVAAICHKYGIEILGPPPSL